MNKKRKSLIKTRAIAFSHQNGHCYYCDQPMWNEKPHKFSSDYSITLPQTKRFQCTGEHLIPHQDGGTSAQKNIVAACWFCNQQRHRRKSDPNPTQYRNYVQHRMNKGRWHYFKLVS